MLCPSTGKIGYPSAAAAQRAAARFKQRRGHQRDGKNHAYFCGFGCGTFHIGHDRDSRKPKLSKRK